MIQAEVLLTKIVNGSSLQPLSGATRRIVLLLHGFGSNGADLISVAPHWQRQCPDALFLAPNAPQRCGPMAGGYQWWPLSAFSPQPLAAGAASAAPAINTFIDRKLDQYGLTEADLAIVGFSQGTMMALHVGLRRAHQVAAIVGYSGMLTGAADLAHVPVTKPPVLLIHGSADPIVPVAALHAAKADLERVGIVVSEHVSPGLGHSVDTQGLELGGAFVAKAFANQRVEP